MARLVCAACACYITRDEPYEENEHMGEVHTSRRACEEAVARDPYHPDPTYLDRLDRPKAGR